MVNYDDVYEDDYEDKEDDDYEDDDSYEDDDEIRIGGDCVEIMSDKLICVREIRFELSDSNTGRKLSGTLTIIRPDNNPYREILELKWNDDVKVDIDEKALTQTIVQAMWTQCNGVRMLI